MSDPRYTGTPLILDLTPTSAAVAKEGLGCVARTCGTGRESVQFHMIRSRQRARAVLATLQSLAAALHRYTPHTVALYCMASSSSFPASVMLSPFFSSTSIFLKGKLLLFGIPVHRHVQSGQV